MASTTGIPENAPASQESEPLLGRPGDASQQEHQGVQYNFFIGTGTVAQAGIWIVSCQHPCLSAQDTTDPLAACGLSLVCHIHERPHPLFCPSGMATYKGFAACYTDCSSSSTRPVFSSLSRASSSFSLPTPPSKRLWERISISL